MDKQRQFLQAYEYLCHIGEAKEWIEDIIHKPIPPIIQLEEALRDGVTIAEIVQALIPDRPIRIFHHPKLQFRHSDNIAVFFRFLDEVELPELFRFELIDLYEKKNIPKVIYCIHALSWLLFRNGMVDFRIGNLVGQLQFEDHELEETQKGLDKAGINMPSFSGMGASFGAEPEPEPEPVETEEERLARELGEQEAMIIDLQGQMRGALMRMQLGNLMNGLWDAEEMLIDLQSRIRGDWARQIFNYRRDMKRFAVDLQSAVRGFLVRKRQQNKEANWKAHEPQVLLLQSLIRARRSREQTKTIKTQMRREESGVKRLQAAIRGGLQRQHLQRQQGQAQRAQAGVEKLQAAIRGTLERQRLHLQQEQVCHAQISIEQLQAAIRGTRHRKRLEYQQQELYHGQASIKQLQAAIRGTLHRKRLESQQVQVQRAEAGVEKLQAATRGMLTRQRQKYQAVQLKAANAQVIEFQAAIRGYAVRLRIENQEEGLFSHEGAFASLQAAIRGVLVRDQVQGLRDEITSHEQSITLLQSHIRAHDIRHGVNDLRSALQEETGSITLLQSACQGFIFRSRHREDMKALKKSTPTVVALQSHIRALLLRQYRNDLLDELDTHKPEVVQLQALARAMMVRLEVGELLDQLEQLEPSIERLQAAARGVLVRAQFAEKKRFFKENMEKVVKVQSFVRGKLQGQAYKSLTNGKNPPVGTVKNFVHLLNDSDFDFDEEIEFEQLRKTVVTHVRQNETADQYIQQLDIKIALLVKNKITLDEVVKHQKHFGGSVGNLLSTSELASKDPFDLKALNKNSRKKLEHYQELFFILQTQPQYLARLFKKIREQATAEKEGERIKHLIMGLFGYAQKRREEYYLLKLLDRSLKEEIDGCESLQDYLRGNFFWAKVFGAYSKSPRDRKYLRDILGPIIQNNILENAEINLESDPLQIYYAALDDEQLRTGQRSQRRREVTREEAIRDEETKRTFIAHLQDLRDIVDQLLMVLEELLPRMPYGVRHTANQMFQSLVARFKYEEQGHILQIVGHWVWKGYIQPALLEPEKFGVIDRGLTQDHRRNLAEVGKVMGQVAIGRLFGNDHVFLQPLNSYVQESIARLGEIWALCK